MTQPSLDLPDPLHPPAAGPPGGTDDLLAQMAGDEINRLLAQADGEPPAAPVTRPPTIAATAAVPSAVPDVAAGAGAPDAVGPAPAPGGGSAGLPSDAMISQELDQVFARQVSADGPGPARDGGRADTLSADGVSDLLGRLAGGEQPVEVEAEHGYRHEPTGRGGEGSAANLTHGSQAVAGTFADRDDLGSDGQGGATFSAQGRAAAAGSVPTTARRPGRWVRRLMLPLDPFPDRMRDVVGKVAIVTTLNAVAVLIYVLLFR